MMWRKKSKSESRQLQNVLTPLRIHGPRSTGFWSQRSPSLRTKSQAAEVSQAELGAARFARESWLTSFIARTEKDLPLADLDEVLARDESWIQSERESLKQLDEQVKAAEGACQVHANQLQQHLQTQPTQDKQVILASLQALNEDVAQAKARLSRALRL